MVREDSSDLLRGPGAGTQTVVGVGRGDFLRIFPGGRHDKSPAGVDGKANRCGLLRSMNGQVDLSRHLMNKARMC